MTAHHIRILALILAIVGAAALRLVPHPPNFSPIDAMALFGGAYLGRKAIAFVAPLAAMLRAVATLASMPTVLSASAWTSGISATAPLRMDRATVVAPPGSNGYTRPISSIASGDNP